MRNSVLHKSQKTLNSTEATYDDDDMSPEDYGFSYWNDDDDPIDEAEYLRRKVKLESPTAGDVKKFKVYEESQGNVVKVNFGQKGVKIKKSNPQDVRALELDITVIIRSKDIRHDIGAIRKMVDEGYTEYGYRGPKR